MNENCSCRTDRQLLANSQRLPSTDDAQDAADAADAADDADAADAAATAVSTSNYRC